MRIDPGTVCIPTHWPTSCRPGQHRAYRPGSRVHLDREDRNRKRLRGRIEAIFDWATVSKYRSGDNPESWKGHLDYLLADPARIAPMENRPAMPWQEAPAFMTQLRLRDGASPRALEFAIYPAARSGEVRRARREEIDVAEAVWTLSAERMKLRASIVCRCRAASLNCIELSALSAISSFQATAEG